MSNNPNGYNTVKTPIVDTEGNYIVMKIQYGKDIIQIVGVYLEPGNPPCPNIYNKLNEIQKHGRT